MLSDDIEYYRIREREELLAADNSSDQICRIIHLDLARLYRMRIVELEANSDAFVDDEGFAAPSRPPFIA